MFAKAIGTAPRRPKGPAVFAAGWTGIIVLLASALVLAFLTAPFVHGGPDAERLVGLTLLDHVGRSYVDDALWLRFWLALLGAVIAAAVSGVMTWTRTPLADIGVTMPHESDPCLHRDAFARQALIQRFMHKYGPNCQADLTLAPGIPLPREAESDFVLVVGNKGSGKSSLVRAFASQAIARGDRVLLHCVKGDVAASFAADEAVLIGAHHAHGWAWDAAADLDGDAAFMDLAAAIIPISGSSPFWAQSARAVFVDVLHDLVAEPGRQGWTFRDLYERLFADPERLKERISRLDLSASPLIEIGDDGLVNTSFGILATLWSATLTGVRPLALAWSDIPPNRRFSVKRWLRGEGLATVVIQTTPEYKEISEIVSTTLLGRVVVGVSDPSFAVDTKRRVTFVLDEFHALGRVPRFETALALGREKGLVVVAALQSLAQLPEVYGQNVGQIVQDLFGIRIFSALSAGESADKASNLIGRRTLVWRERNNDSDKKGLYRHERGERPLISTKEFETELGVRLVGTDPNNPDHKRLRAVIAGFGDAHLLDWPLTIWPKLRNGYVPAPWLKAYRRHTPAPTSGATAATPPNPNPPR